MDDDAQVEPVSQLYQLKENKGGSRLLEAYDTSDIRRYLERQLKGKQVVEVEYQFYELIKKSPEGDEVVSQFLARNDDHARTLINQYCDVQDIDIRTIKARPTGDTQTKEEVRQVYPPLLPDDVVNKLLPTIDPTFSRIQWMTKYDEHTIKETLWRNISKIRQRLWTLYHERDDLDPSNFPLVINLIWNMLEPVLYGSKDGFTAHGLRDRSQERMVTYTDDKKKVMGFGG